MPNITRTTQLRELYQDGFVLRTVYSEIPRKVEYILSVQVRREC
ncbi:winged helix-turn-helix transcriptional regulator [Gluconobacter frateurii]|nr:winged helix-turn-helix transcriptional regulator [Gluconobacter frateurii]UMM08728.1 winged helix-turn-helix transcriptional regulator [Gluconobacter frateurii]